MAGVCSLLVLLLVFNSSCLGFRSPLSVFKRFKETTRPFSNECLGPSRPVTPIDSSDFALDIRMPGVTPKQDALDYHQCRPFPLVFWGKFEDYRGVPVLLSQPLANSCLILYLFFEESQIML